MHLTVPQSIVSFDRNSVTKKIKANFQNVDFTDIDSEATLHSSHEKNNFNLQEEGTARKCLRTNHMTDMAIPGERSCCQCRCCCYCQEQYFIDTIQRCSKIKSNYASQLEAFNDHHRKLRHVSCLTRHQTKSQFEESNYNFRQEQSRNLAFIQSSRHNSTISIVTKKLLIIFVIHSILSHLNLLHQCTQRQSGYTSLIQRIFVRAEESSNDYCDNNFDCKDGDRFCHENKCMCPRDRPIEDKERSACLPLALINEGCFTDNQCLSDAKCIDGVCACAPDFISLYNPSTKVYYCHPKRRLNEECNHDAQCPENAFCSIKKHGCLCQNGYGAAILTNNGVEMLECLPKACTLSSDCESEYHTCDENKCKCLATHFDPHTALCYKFGSTGGQLDGDSTVNKTLVDNQISSPQDNDNSNIIDSILKDLTNNGDRMWPIIVALILLIIFLLALMICLASKYCLSYCWTARKKEYEPNNSTDNKQHLSKNSIHNKSFRQKKGETDNDDDDERNTDEDGDNTAADISNLMTTSPKGGNIYKEGKKTSRMPFKSNGNINSGDNHYVKVDMSNSYSTNEANDQQSLKANGHHYQPFHQVLSRPLASSTSTPV